MAEGQDNKTPDPKVPEADPASGIPASKLDLSKAPLVTPAPARVTLAKASDVSPPPPPVEPVIKSENTFVGYSLAQIFSGILAVYLLFAIGSLWFSEAKMLAKMDSLTQGLTISELNKSSNQTNRITKEDVEMLTKSVSDAYKETRATTVDFHKTVIVNVLLPILTALLGYIFANREKSEPKQDGK